MAVQRMACSLSLFLLLSLVQPLGGQVRIGHRWTANRPDAQGPASVSEDRTLPAGEVQVAVKYSHRQLSGQGDGTDSLALGWVLGLYDVAPSRMLTQGLSVDLLVGVSPQLTVVASAAFSRKTLDNLTRLDDQPGGVFPFQTKVSGLQDVRVSALYNVHDRGPIRVHVHGGVSVPVGAIDRVAVTPVSDDAPAQLPYVLQLGSGTFDLLPGLTLSIQNEKASLGVQAKGTIRLGKNDRGWTLGDVVEASAWAGYHQSRWVSASLGAAFCTWGNVRGYDRALDPDESPTHNPLAQGGRRVLLPMGINIVMPPGRLEGHRFSVDFLPPVHQDLDGPQLRHRWSLTLGWQRAVSF